MDDGEHPPLEADTEGAAVNITIFGITPESQKAVVHYLLDGEMRQFVDPDPEQLAKLAKLISSDVCQFRNYVHSDDPQVFENARPWSTVDSPGNWITFRLNTDQDFDGLCMQISNPIVKPEFCLCIFEGAYGESKTLKPLARPAQYRPPAAKAPHIFKALSPEGNWAVLPFERKNLWAKICEFIMGIEVVPAKSSPVGNKVGTAFWILAFLLLALFILLCTLGVRALRSEEAVSLMDRWLPRRGH
jgi:hypothetical protein